MRNPGIQRFRQSDFRGQIDCLFRHGFPKVVDARRRIVPKRSNVSAKYDNYSEDASKKPK